MLFSTVSPAQESNAGKIKDSLSLAQVVGRIVASYPSVLKADNDTESAAVKIALAKSVFLPTAELSASYSRIGPISEFTLPDIGSFSLYPADNYSASISVNQLITDFGKSKKGTEIEQINQNMLKLSAEQLRQKLSGSGASLFYSVIYLSEAAKIKEEEIANLNEHLRFVQKKSATGAATDYQILTTQVKIANAENVKTDILTTLKIQQVNLNLLMNLDKGTEVVFKKELLDPMTVESEDYLITKAFSMRTEMKLSNEKIGLNDARMKQAISQNNPVVSLIASGGVKNGYIPDQMNPKINFSLGAGIRVPILDANRSKYNRMLIKAEGESVGYELDATKNTIINEVVECKANVEASLRKIRQSELQLKQAVKAFELAQTSFTAGSVTNLDLLDASSALSDSKLNLLKSKIDYTINLIKLKIATGERIYN